PFRLFEGFRSAQRQEYLYAQGRTRPGAIITKAPPWSSLHQYGVAGDFVLFESGWSWDDSGTRERWWDRLHEAGYAHGLMPLSWEQPHLQLADVSIEDLRDGHFPAGGDLSWAECLEVAILSWSGTPPAPLLPAILPARPPLAAEDALVVVPGDAVRGGTGDWHRRFDGCEWRYDGQGVYLRSLGSGLEPLRTAGEPLTCPRVWEPVA